MAARRGGARADLVYVSGALLRNDILAVALDELMCDMIDLIRVVKGYTMSLLISCDAGRVLF